MRAQLLVPDDCRVSFDKHEREDARCGTVIHSGVQRAALHDESNVTAVHSARRAVLDRCPRANAAIRRIDEAIGLGASPRIDVPEMEVVDAAKT